MEQQAVPRDDEGGILVGSLVSRKNERTAKEFDVFSSAFLIAGG